MVSSVWAMLGNSSKIFEFFTILSVTKSTGDGGYGQAEWDKQKNLTF